MRSAQIFDAASRTLEQLSSLSASVIPALSTALLVAKHLGDSEHERWLGCELRGYKNPTSGSSFTTLAEALQVPETTELIRRIGDYRTMQTFFYVSGPQGLEKWPYPFFVPDSASKIESSSGIYASAPIISAEVKALPALLEIMRSAGLPGDTVTIHFTYRQ